MEDLNLLNECSSPELYIDEGWFSANSNSTTLRSRYNPVTGDFITIIRENHYKVITRTFVCSSPEALIVLCRRFYMDIFEHNDLSVSLIDANSQLVVPDYIRNREPCDCGIQPQGVIPRTNRIIQDFFEFCSEEELESCGGEFTDSQGIKRLCFDESKQIEIVKKHKQEYLERFLSFVKDAIMFMTATRSKTNIETPKAPCTGNIANRPRPIPVTAVAPSSINTPSTKDTIELDVEPIEDPDNLYPNSNVFYVPSSGAIIIQKGDSDTDFRAVGKLDSKQESLANIKPLSEEDKVVLISMDILIV